MYSVTAGELEHLRGPLFHMKVIIIDPDHGLIFDEYDLKDAFTFSGLKESSLKKNEIVYVRTLVIFPGGCHSDTFIFVFSGI